MKSKCDIGEEDLELEKMANNQFVGCRVSDFNNT
jgi:hypothetical protein